MTEIAAESGSDGPVEPKGSAERQRYMRKLVEEGQAKVTTASKLTNGLGDVAHFVLSVKAMIDLAVQNIPQAALPWAGVCVGLQVSTLCPLIPGRNMPVTYLPLDSSKSWKSYKVQPGRPHPCHLQDGLVLQPS